MHLQDEQDAHWAAVSQATQLGYQSRTQQRRDRHPQLRMRAGLWLVHTGLRLVDPLTIEGLLNS